MQFVYESGLTKIIQFSQADLSKADLTEANLKNADLSEANLSGADITPEQLAQAKSLQGATMPDGKLHP